MRKTFKILFATILMFLFSASSCMAGGVVLALSGGGTRGFAHVGVLKVLAEENIPIAGIVGTSMGSIIGGVAACGYSPSEIEEIVMDLDMRNLLYDRTQPSLSRLGAEDYGESMSIGRVFLNKKGEVVGPLGGLSGIKLLRKLEEITSPCINITDFNRLPIPFAAVATDLYHGGPVLLRSGSLAEAMRASMSIPGLFQPWKIGNRLLVDGGLVANLPVRIAKEIFPGYPVIAVDISSEKKEPGQIRSIVDVLDQSINIMTARDLEIDRQRADLLIRPDVGGLPMLSTSDFTTIIDTGEIQTRRQISDIRYLAQNAPAVPDRQIITGKWEGPGDWTPDLNYYEAQSDHKYETIFGGYYSSFHDRNYLFADLITRNFLEDGDSLLRQFILGREWGIKYSYQNAGETWRKRSEYSFTARHREFDPSNAPATRWERYALDFTERTLLGHFRIGIGLTAEYFDSDQGEDSHIGPKASIIYNTLDDALDPARGVYVRTDIYWRDLDILMGRMEFKGVAQIGGTLAKMILEGGFFAGDMSNPYSRAYLGAREELHSLADHPLAGENTAWWKTTLRRVLTESWWGTINGDIFFTQGYLLDDSFKTLEEPWETGIGLYIPGSLLNATVFAVYTDEEDWDFGATIGIPIRNPSSSP